MPSEHEAGSQRKRGGLLCPDLQPAARHLQVLQVTERGLRLGEPLQVGTHRLVAQQGREELDRVAQILQADA